MIRKEFDELKSSGKLPSPSGIGLKVMQLTQTNDWEVDDLVSVISADPALTSRVIKLANSVQISGINPVATLGDAALRVGARNVSNQALAFSLISGNRIGRCEAFNYERYWSESLACGVSAEIISKKLRKANPSEAFTCALLSTVGQLGLASVHPFAYSELIVASKTGPGIELLNLENERFSINSREVTIALMADWGLPDYFGEAVSYQKRGIRGNERGDSKALELVGVLRMARSLAQFCVSTDQEKIKQWPILARLRDDLGFDQDGFSGFCRSIAERWDDWGANLKLPTTGLSGMEDIERRATMFRPEDESSLALGDEVDPDKFRSLRILAVDDEPVSLRVLAGQLKIAGHDVLTARDGEEALAMTLDCNPHIVISDWNMPKMDGLELCKALRRAQAGHGVYFLLLTGHDEEARVVEGFEGGIDDYVSKPFNPKILLARVRAGLRLVNLREQVDLEQTAQREKTAELGVLTRQLRDAAFTDFLTKLPNRRFGMEKLEDEWDAWRKSGESLSVIMIDIDFFKEINDKHGHDVGDLVLREIAKVMSKVVRGADVVARIGGEEFIVICPETDNQGALDCGERLRYAVEAHQVESPEYSGSVTISLGVSTASESISDAYAFLKIADEAVYKAKAEGRNCVRGAIVDAERLPKSA